MPEEPHSNRFEPPSEANANPAAAVLSPSDARWNLFFGPLGLRAGWGIALYFTAASILLLFGLGLASLLHSGSTDKRNAHHVAASRATQPAPSPDQSAGAPSQAAISPQTRELLTAGSVAINDGTLLLAIGASALLLARLERRSASVYGLDARFWKDALPGALTGLLLLSGLLAVLHLLHLVVFDGVLLNASQAVRSGIGWLFAFTLVGLFEEYFFRGYLQYTLTRGLLRSGGRMTTERARAVAFSLAAVLLSLLFSLVHVSNSGETLAGIGAVFVAGLVFSYALWRTGSLWWGVGFHAAWDWAQSFLFGVPDSGKFSAGRLLATHPAGNLMLSGGPAGPEGSLLVLPTLFAVVLVLQGMRPRPQPALEAADEPWRHGASSPQRF